MYPPDQLNEVLAKSDYVVVTLPSTPATDKFVSREAISHLQPHAVFINLGRGTTVDEEALTEGTTCPLLQSTYIAACKYAPSTQLRITLTNTSVGLLLLHIAI